MDSGFRACYVEIYNVAVGAPMTSKEPESRPRLQTIQALLTRPPPSDFATALAEAKQLGALTKQHIADRFAPSLNAELKMRRQGTYDEKKAICRWTNGILRELGLSIRCQKTGKHAILTADPRHPADQGRFRLKTEFDDGKDRTTESHVNLWPLDLMGAPPRKESLADYNRARSEQAGRR
jgi:hypothetical protein